MRALLKRNLDRVRQRLERACDAAGRDPREVALLPVSKYVEADVAAELCELGVTEFAESRVQELASKSATFAARGLTPRWHLVGHLQRNKARTAVRCADSLHSLDSLRLIETLQRVCAEEQARPEVFLEVRLVADSARHGFDPAELPEAVEQARNAPNLKLVGLMGMAPAPESGASGPNAGDDRPARRAFAALAALRETLPAAAFHSGRALLSMGMSADLEAAVAEGSDLVRVGSALFEGLPRRTRPAPAAPEGP